MTPVWIVDFRGGKKNGRTWIERVKRRCNLVLAGRIDEVWQEACEIELKRQAIRKRSKTRNKSGVKVVGTPAKEHQKMELNINC